MTRLAPLVAAFAAALALVPLAHAQSDEDLRRVVLANGTVYVGTVADEAADPVVIVTRDGITRTFDRAQVEVIAPLIEGRFFRTDPVRTRFLFAPTARTQGGGEFRGDLTGFFPSVTVGLSDRVDFLGSGFLSFGDEAALTPLLGLKGQVYSSETVQAALGVSGVLALGGSTEFGAVPYGVVTVGRETRSASIGVAGGVGTVFGDEFGAAEGVVVFAGADRQINNGVKLFVESYIGVGLDGSGTTGVLVVPGVRFFGDSFAFDVVGFVATDFESAPIGFAPLPARLSYTF